jgi:hypothetical protein
LVNFKEFGKVMVKSTLDSDLEKHRIIEKDELDEPFSFPNDSIFQEQVAVTIFQFRIFWENKTDGLLDRSFKGLKILTLARLGLSSCIFLIFTKEPGS